MSASDLRWRLRLAQKSVASWLSTSGGGAGGKRISTPQLVKRNVHVTVDRNTGVYQGVPTRWKPDFDKLEKKQEITAELATFEVESTLTAATREEDHHDHLGMSSDSGREVWFDQSTRTFVNLPGHWQERMERNSLLEWVEFQRNPRTLVTVFTMMDEELRKMDLKLFGLDESIYSSPIEGYQNGIDSLHHDENHQGVHSPPQEDNHQSAVSPLEEEHKSFTPSSQEANQQSDFSTPPQSDNHQSVLVRQGSRHQIALSSMRNSNHQSIFSLPEESNHQSVISTPPQSDNHQSVVLTQGDRHKIALSSLRSSIQQSVISSPTQEEAHTSSKTETQMHSQHHSDDSQSSDTPVPTITQTGGSNRSLVWTQQRSFVKDSESDSEEFVEL